jgi:hypothetical protein
MPPTSRALPFHFLVAFASITAALVYFLLTFLMPSSLPLNQI